MSPTMLRALTRQRRIKRNADASGWGHLYLSALGEWRHSADWYRRAMATMPTPMWCSAA